MNVWLYNKKMIPLLRYNVLVLAVLHKLNRRVFIANAFSLSFYWSQVTLTLCKQDIHTYIHKLYLSSDFSVAYIASISDPN